MASDIRKRDTLFPGSDPGNFGEDSNPSSNHNIPIPQITQEQIRRIHLNNGWPQSSGSTVPEKRSSREKPGSHLSHSGYKEGDETTGFKRTKIEQRIRRSSRVTYHEFMVLEQAGSANMGCDNSKRCNLVAIKRLKGVDKNSAYWMRAPTNDHVVNIKLFSEIHSYFVSLLHHLGALYSRLPLSEASAVCQITVQEDGLNSRARPQSVHTASLKTKNIEKLRDQDATPRPKSVDAATTKFATCNPSVTQCAPIPIDQPTQRQVVF